MLQRIGIIKETKNNWEKRAPLVPGDTMSFTDRSDVQIIIQPSDLRIFRETEYMDAGCTVAEDLSICDLILGIKEIKIEDLLPKMMYMFFSHTIKGQDYNMPLLQKLLDLGCTLFDYEKIARESGERLIFFSYHAGLAGVIDTFWSLGRRLTWEGIDTPFAEIKQTTEYDSLHEAETAFRKVGSAISSNGLSSALSPFVIGITGYGNVSGGAQHLIDLLPVTTISPVELLNLQKGGDFSAKKVYKVVFKEEHMVRHKTSENFDLQNYYTNPGEYNADFEKYLPFIDVLVNASYWDTPYPRHVTKSYLKQIFSEEEKPKLRVIGDISCDIEGGIEATLEATDPGNPYFTYDTEQDVISTSFSARGPVIMSVDNLPSELPRDSSVYFSGVLKTLLPDIINSEYPEDFSALELPYHLKNAIIVYKGKLAPGYQYLNTFLEKIST